LTRQIGPCRKQAAAARHDDIANTAKTNPYRVPMSERGRIGSRRGRSWLYAGWRLRRRLLPAFAIHAATLPWLCRLDYPVRDWISFKL
jgi:hypothetical protein